MNSFEELEHSLLIDQTPDGYSVTIKFCGFSNPQDANDFIALMTEGMPWSPAPSSEVSD